MGPAPEETPRRSHPEYWVGALGAYTLVVSILQLSAAAVGLSAWNCGMTNNVTIQWQAVRLYYFANVDCKESYYVNRSMYYLAGENNASYRTMVIMGLYTALCSVWIIGSFLLLASAIKGKHMKPMTGRILHYPWTISMGCVHLLDAIAAILYTIDLSSTSDFRTLMGLLNIKPDGGLSEVEDRTMAPIIMALLTSKGVLFWVIDVILLCLIQRQFHKLFHIRLQAEFVRAQLSSMPSYMLPPKMRKHQSGGDKNADAAEPPAPPVIPRLTNKDGLWVGDARAPSPTSMSMSTKGRTSALQMAARQGFSYERPPSGPSGPWSSALPGHGDTQRLPRLTSPQKYGYGGGDGDGYDGPDYWRPDNFSQRGDHDKMSNIPQRDNDVFY